MEKNQICRMKADGSGYEVLGWGQSPTIYKDRIYYIKNKAIRKLRPLKDEQKQV